MSEFIKRMGHVALQVPDLDASVGWATTVMGLREVERADGVSYLTHGDPHHSLQLIAAPAAGLDHIAMEARDDAALDRLADRLAGAGIALVSEEPEERALGRALRFRAPEGHLIEVFTQMECGLGAFNPTGIQPRKFGHPTLTCPEPVRTRDLFEDVLDFRLSDTIGGDVLTFLRCGVDHHGIGLQKGPPGLNHYAWEVESLATLGALGDLLARNDSRFIWGPGRHAAGNNIFTYHFDPAGAVVEYYADLYQVWDEDTYVPGEWTMDDHRAQNLWGPGVPEELILAATPVAETLIEGAR
jgi:catechol 2,3-dioxygenase-like lactoylglutathione lyase family enzyme